MGLFVVRKLVRVVLFSVLWTVVVLFVYKVSMIYFESKVDALSAMLRDYLGMVWAWLFLMWMLPGDNGPAHNQSE